MKILIANPGSTSYKCKLFDTTNWEVIFQAGVERIGDAQGIITCQFKGRDKTVENRPVPDYIQAVNLTLDVLKRTVPLKDIAAAGFKTVLAKGVTGCVRLTPDVISAMKEFEPLAPVHTRVYLHAISVFEKVLPSVPRVGLFETAFHAAIPPEAYLYGIPYGYFEKYGIRKYGFHGASHRYVARRVKELYFDDWPGVNVISCHLGGSASVCAVKNGVSVDTSMGMSPQSGLLNAKRVGDLDPFALLYLMEKENLSIAQTRDLLISKSGVFGISGKSGDFRDIEKAMDSGDARAELAFKTFAYIVRRYIGEYLAVLNGADCIAFTAGIGQNQHRLRRAALEGMDKLGVVLDGEKNGTTKEGIISADHSKILVAVLATDEERIVAEEVEKLLA